MTKQALLIGRSDFSIGESILSLSDFVETSAEKGHKHIALADTMTVSGMPEFTKLCKKHDIRPIIGCRIRVTEDASYRYGKARKPKEYYPMVWPKDQKGFQDLLMMLTVATDSDHFYYVPRLSFHELITFAKEGNMIVTTGDIQSLAEHPQWCQQAIDELGDDTFYFQYQHHDGPYFTAINHALGEMTCSDVWTRPALYPFDKAEAHDTMSAISRRATVSSPWRNKLYYRDLHVVGPEVLELPSFATCTGAFIDECNYEYEKQPISMPDMAEGTGKTEIEILKEKLVVGWKKRLHRDIMGHKPTESDFAEYKERLRYELGVIQTMEFERYFLLVEDLVRWAKENGILVGPGRGSVGGSLIAYLLGITDVDPIRFGLLFERFINPDRLDLPDADLDFQSSRRHEVIEYLKEKYGEDKVAGIVNFNSIVSKGALRDVGRVFELPHKVLFVSKLVPDEYGKSFPLEDAAAAVPALEDFSNKYPDVWRNACNLQGVQRSLGRHAAGVVVAGEPLVNRAVVDHSKDEPAVGWDKRTVEDMGLVKIDILGLSNLDVLELALKYIQEGEGKTVDLFDVPLTDEKTLKAFSEGQTAGVFQFESAGMRKLLEDLAMGAGTLTFDDLTAATSLYRPGPKDSGLLDDYVAIKQGLKRPTYEHPALERALHETQGVTIYQEQVSKIATYLCGFNGTEADHLRKAMGKKDPEKMKEWRSRFVEGAASHSKFPEARAEKLFHQIEAFAGYAFNKSHAVEYSIISFWTMYLKVHHPAEFFAAALSILKEEKLEGLVRAAQKHDLNVLPPDINTSTDRFEIVKNSSGKFLVAPFNRVKQISDKTANHLMEVRKEGGPFKSVDDLNDRTTGRTFNKRHKENLDKVGAFVSIQVEPLPMAVLDERRRKDQLELLPGLITSVVHADRRISDDEASKNSLINDVIRPCSTCENCDLAGKVHPVPRLGGKAQFMVITDCPNFSEENDNKMLSGKASNYVREALKFNKLQVGQGYFTSLVKAQKDGKFLTNEQINGCKDWLEKEMEILKPPVIVLLGNSTVRHLASEIKTGMENAGRVVYRPDIDASLVIGFNPASITFDSSKQDTLNEIFGRVKEIIG